MSTNSNRILKLAAAVGVTTIVAMSSVTPSLATNSNDGGPFIFESNGDGSAWSYYPGYVAAGKAGTSVNNSEAANARAQVKGAPHRSGVRADDPPGSAFQSWGNTDSLGGR